MNQAIEDRENTEIKEKKKIDGQELYNAFAKGAEKVIEKRKSLDEINVFPVADSDTGKNMARTLRSVAQSSKPEPSVGTVTKDMAQAALLGSRGNSGIILAQFLNGMSKATGDREHLHLDEFAHAMKVAANHAYEATNQPVDGTILTVMKDWSRSLNEFTSRKKDLMESLDYSLESARESLQETKSRLKELREADVVDAGAKGFVLFLEGVSTFFKEGSTASFSRLKDLDRETSPHSIEESQGVEGPRYCTEVVLTGDELDSEELKREAEQFGESLVVAGGNGQYHVHIHTDNPGQLVYQLEKTGVVADQKVDDMQKQHQAAYERETDVALVTDSTCDLPEEVIDSFPIYTVPLKVNFGDNQFMDKVTIKPEQFYQMLEELGSEDEFPTSSQPSIGDFLDTYSFLLEHYDSVLSLHLSGELSGTYEAALEAANRVDEERIRVVDSKQLSTSLGLVVQELAREIESGSEIDQLVKKAQKLSDKSRILVSVRDLKYMIQGGRVSKLKGLLARILNFKPIISVEDGESALHGKPLFRSTNYRQILNMMEGADEENGIKDYAIGHVSAESEAEKLTDMIEDQLGLEPDYTMDISPLIGSHAGIGAVAVSYLTE
ncbi:DegV family EDD domain-containing protein [Candidatus Bipolaricaulota bacterium]|nr:DegV family EDD domain-containing protein [Candidatus Bipolaricaulota bacterium]